MCGRYAMAIRMALIREQLEMDGMNVDEELPPDDAVRQSYNVAPGYFEPVYRAVIEGGGGGGSRAAAGDNDASDGAVDDQGNADDENDEERDDINDDTPAATNKKIKYVLSPMKWGLIPFWTKRNPDYASMLKTINCRDDSLFDNKGMWTTMKNKKRCIVLAQGFFEWLTKGKDKVPHYTKRTDRKLLCMAGLWDSVKYEDAKDELYTYSIITTSSSKQLSFLHDRMPVIFDPGSPEIKMWLDPTRKWDMELQKLLKPYEKSGLETYQVKKEVGKVGNNSPLFIVPLDSKENKSNIKNFFAAGNKKTSAKAEDKVKEIKGEEGKEIEGENEEETKEDHKEETREELKEEGKVEELKAKDKSSSEDIKTEKEDLVEKATVEENGDVPEDGDERPKETPEEDVDAAALMPAPDPSKLSPHRSPTKQLHITPKSAKRKFSDLTPDSSMQMLQLSPTKSPSPVKSQQGSYYSSSTLGSSPKKAGNPFSSPSKKQKTSPDAKDLKNTSITSFFSKK